MQYCENIKRGISVYLSSPEEHILPDKLLRGEVLHAFCELLCLKYLRTISSTRTQVRNIPRNSPVQQMNAHGAVMSLNFKTLH